MKQSKLLQDIKFWPLFWTQFCGAFNDNVFKFALIGLIVAQGDQLNLLGMDSKELQTFATGLFILPFFLFSANAGQLADKYDKSTLIRYIKILEICIMSLAVYGFLTNNILWLLLVLFLMGMQSTLFGPVKYSILPQHIKPEQLTAANGLIEMATFLAILIGTILGTWLISLIKVGPVVICIAIMTIAILGWVFSRKIPTAPAPDPGLKLSFNFVWRTYKQVSHARRSRIVFLSIVGISWFWFVGATLLTLIQPLAKEVFHGGVDIRILFLAVTSIGIGAGSVLCDKLTHGDLSNHLIPIGALGITLFGADIWLSSQAILEALPLASKPAESVGIGLFLSHWQGYRLLLDLLLFGVAGGFYIVPLYVILQLRSDPEHRSRNIAVNNIMNALFMVISAVMIISLFAMKFSITEVILTTALLNLVITGLLFWRMPELIQDFLNWSRRNKKDQTPDKLP